MFIFAMALSSPGPRVGQDGLEHAKLLRAGCDSARSSRQIRRRRCIFGMGCVGRWVRRGSVGTTVRRSRSGPRSNTKSITGTYMPRKRTSLPQLTTGSVSTTACGVTPRSHSKHLLLELRTLLSTVRGEPHRALLGNARHCLRRARSRADCWESPVSVETVSVRGRNSQHVSAAGRPAICRHAMRTGAPVWAPCGRLSIPTSLLRCAAGRCAVGIAGR